ncbi:CUB and sushi domain-containing protein 3 [Nymphon striatum]|nr:CUB and sushi domain-containing protein 3 [Nymphon striatum]
MLMGHIISKDGVKIALDKIKAVKDMKHQLFPNTIKQAEIMKDLHNGHQGMTKTQQRARVVLYWPGMAQRIEDLISLLNSPKYWLDRATSKLRDKLRKFLALDTSTNTVVVDDRERQFTDLVHHSQLDATMDLIYPNPLTTAIFNLINNHDHPTPQPERQTPAMNPIADYRIGSSRLVVKPKRYMDKACPGGENNCEQRNVTAASIQGHICQNSCGTKRDCLSAVRICVCDGICGKSCVRTHLKCQKPKNPNNGMVHSTSLRYNSVITYTCNQGYKLIGNDSRVCRGHGKWDKQPPTCEKYDKSSVEKSLSNTTENLDEDTEFHTNQETSKYNKNRTTSKTSHVTVSTNSKLFETTSVSSPDIDSSVLIGEISSGEDNEDPKVPKIDKKFIGGGIWDIRQNSNNTESSIPQVSVTESLYNAKELGRFLDKVTALGGDKECLDPPKITNSIITGKNAGYVIDTEMEYKCNYGFYVAPEINGRRIITKTRCIQNVENNSVFWTGLNMICRKKSCSDPGDILRGSRIGYVFTVGNEVKYTCDEGYKMIGRPVIFCTPSAKWNRSPPKCQGQFEIVQCEPPEFLLNGKIEVGTGPILTGYIITFRCNIRNILIGSSTSRCLEDGNWSFQLPECKEHINNLPPFLQAEK